MFVAAFIISFSTSFPVINKLFGTNLATSGERIDYYNQWITPFAIITALLLAIGQFLKYTKTDMRQFWKNIAIAGFISAIITTSVALSMDMRNPIYISLLFTSSLAATSNTDYWLRFLRGKMKAASASIAHIGFGLLLLGVLISTTQSEIISSNTSLYDISVLGEDFSNNENILLMQDDTLIMGDFFVSYRGKKAEDNFIHYEVEYMQPNKDGKLEKQFTLFPFLQLNPRMGNVAEPYTKHYLHKDIYTHISYAELEDRDEKATIGKHSISIGDTIFTKTSFMVFDSLDRQAKDRFAGLAAEDLAIGAHFTLYDVNTEAHELKPLFVLKNREHPMTVSDSMPEAGIKLSFEGIDPEAESFNFRVVEDAPKFNDFIVMKAIVFPGINILWIGCIIMGLGSFLAVWQRIKRK